MGPYQHNQMKRVHRDTACRAPFATPSQWERGLYDTLLERETQTGRAGKRSASRRQRFRSYEAGSAGILPASAGTGRREGKAVSPDRCLGDACRLEGGAPSQMMGFVSARENHAGNYA